MSTSDHLPLAIQALCGIAQRDLARLRALRSPKPSVDEATFCDAMVRYGVVEGSRIHLSQPTDQTHHHLCSLLNILLRRAADPVRDETGGAIPSDAFGRAVMRVLIALGPAGIDG